MTALAAPPTVAQPSSLAAPSIGISAPNAAKEKFVPKAPANLREAGLNPSMLESLVLKFLLTNGSASGGAIANTLCLPNAPVIEQLSQLKQQQIVVYVGAANAGDFTYTLTDAGRDRARRMMEDSMYVGAAPVPLDKYIESVKAQTITLMNPSQQDLRRAFSDLLVSEEMFDTLGPAINSGKGMFLYGYRATARPASPSASRAASAMRSISPRRSRSRASSSSCSTARTTKSLRAKAAASCGLTSMMSAG